MSPDLLRALSEVAWPVIAALVIWRLYPLVREILHSRAFTVKVAGMEILAQQASEQLQSQIDDLRTKLSDVRQANRVTTLFTSVRNEADRVGPT